MNSILRGKSGAVQGQACISEWRFLLDALFIYTSLTLSHTKGTKLAKGKKNCKSWKIKEEAREYENRSRKDFCKGWRYGGHIKGVPSTAEPLHHVFPLGAIPMGAVAATHGAAECLESPQFSGNLG